MTADEFRLLVNDKPNNELLDTCLRQDDIPFVFEPRPEAWTDFRVELGNSLRIERGDIRVIGSGRFGFSLKPGNNLKAYSEKSDIDVAIVHADTFDQLWYGLLRAAYPRPPATNHIGGWLKERQKELYTGWLIPLDIRLDHRIFPRAKGLLDITAAWFNTFKAAARHVPRRHEDVKVRLYRTWAHADLYHDHSITALRKALAEVTI
jgi:hypothetical protein